MDAIKDYRRSLMGRNPGDARRNGEPIREALARFLEPRILALIAHHAAAEAAESAAQQGVLVERCCCVCGVSFEARDWFGRRRKTCSRACMRACVSLTKRGS